MKIDPQHPRFASLKIRERLVWGVKKGYTSYAGLLAHGRGEAFDYLLGEHTNRFAIKAIQTGASYLLLAKRPIISVNGNAVVLTGKEFIKLAKLLNCKIEVNLFHYTKKRIVAIERYLKSLDPHCILEHHRNNRQEMPGVKSKRRIMLKDGLVLADTVLVPLEDGDRCQAFVHAGKKVVTVDLNPLSRTAQTATVTIVDNIVRALPILVKEVSHLRFSSRDTLLTIVNSYNNKEILSQALSYINLQLTAFASKRV